MAPQGSNNAKSSKMKKSTSVKKKAVTRTARKKRASPQKLSMKKNILVVLGVLLVIGLVSFGYILGENRTSEPLRAKPKPKEHYSTKQMLKDLARLKTEKPEQAPFKEIQRSAFQQTKEHELPLFKERGKVEEDTTKKKTGYKKTALACRGKKPRLVIIMDDVHTKQQLKAIQKLGFKVTPSIFPPYALAKHSNLLANEIRHSMIHLPMESGNAKLNRQYKTLKTSFSDAQMRARAKEIRKLFPHTIYVNNHTGSVFTSNYQAMKKLYKDLRDEGFVFIDSYTIASSKVKQIAHEFGDAYVRRDVFIDNKQNVDYIHNQLKLAVKKAKKNGYAIAIGHPHKITLQALQSAKYILHDVDLVYIDDIFAKDS